MAIKNIVFDVGNVLVRWNPLAVVQEFFTEEIDHFTLNQQIFKSKTWFDLNLGLISEQELIQKYHKDLNINVDKLQHLMHGIRASLLPLQASLELLADLYKAEIPLYALTDNTHEFMAYLKNTYDFWWQFRGIVVSAEVGYLKPAPEIYRHLLTRYQLQAHETLFIDDHLPNIEGAMVYGMAAIHFESVEDCIKRLKSDYGVL